MLVRLSLHEHFNLQTRRQAAFRQGRDLLPGIVAPPLPAITPLAIDRVCSCARFKEQTEELAVQYGLLRYKIAWEPEVFGLFIGRRGTVLPTDPEGYHPLRQA